jgi:hypothetical protein
VKFLAIPARRERAKQLVRAGLVALWKLGLWKDCGKHRGARAAFAFPVLSCSYAVLHKAGDMRFLMQVLSAGSAHFLKDTPQIAGVAPGLGPACECFVSLPRWPEVCVIYCYTRAAPRNHSRSPDSSRNLQHLPKQLATSPPGVLSSFHRSNINRLLTSSPSVVERATAPAAPVPAAAAAARAPAGAGSLWVLVGTHAY